MRPHRLAGFFTAASAYGSGPPAHGAAPQVGLVRRITRLVIARPSPDAVGAHVPAARPPGHKINQGAKSTSNCHIQPPAPNSALKMDLRTFGASAF